MATTEETAEQVAKARLALEAAEAEHAAALDAGEANKSPGQLAFDLLEELVMKLGNRPPMRVLLNRLKRAIEHPLPPAPSDGEAPTA